MTERVQQVAMMLQQDADAWREIVPGLARNIDRAVDLLTELAAAVPEPDAWLVEPDFSPPRSYIFLDELACRDFVERHHDVDVRHVTPLYRRTTEQPTPNHQNP